MNYVEQYGSAIKIISHEKKEITAQQLIDQYYSNPEVYFDSNMEDPEEIYNYSVNGNTSYLKSLLVSHLQNAIRL